MFSSQPHWDLLLPSFFLLYNPMMSNRFLLLLCLLSLSILWPHALHLPTGHPSLSFHHFPHSVFLVSSSWHDCFLRLPLSFFADCPGPIDSENLGETLTNLTVQPRNPPGASHCLAAADLLFSFPTWTVLWPLTTIPAFPVTWGRRDTGWAGCCLPAEHSHIHLCTSSSSKQPQKQTVDPVQPPTLSTADLQTSQHGKKSFNT